MPTQQPELPNRRCTHAAPRLTVLNSHPTGTTPLYYYIKQHNSVHTAQTTNCAHGMRQLYIYITMRKLLLILLALITLQTTLQADEHKQPKRQRHRARARISGSVYEKGSGQHLPHATVRLKDTTIGITTDNEGNFQLDNLPQGNHTLEVSMMGFKTITQQLKVDDETDHQFRFELDEGTLSLDEIVVSASRNGTTRRQSPSLISIVGIDMLENTSCTTLADGLRFQPGLRVENNCQNCGNTQLRINGLEGPYSQILIDSRPIIGALSGIYSLEQIPANMIERIEVIRGGSSVLFGGNAIGGAVNIVTREPLNNNADFSHNLTSFGNGALENNTTFNASLVSDNRKAGLMIFGQHRLRDAYDYDGDGFTELAQLKNRAMGLRSYLKTSDYSRITLEYQNMHEFRRGGDRLDQQPYMAYITEQTEHHINSGSLKFDQYSHNQKHKLSLFFAAQHTDRHSYYGAGAPYIAYVPEITPDMNAEEINSINEILANNLLRINSFGHSRETNLQAGAQYSYLIDHLWFMPAEFISGAEYLGNNLKDESGYRRMGLSQHAKVASLYAQNEWKNNQWGFLIGLRGDKHNMVSNPIIYPRANIRYNPREDINLRLTYSEGYRAPQIYDENLHVDIAGGETIIRELADNLREERSRSFNLSADYYTRPGNVDLNLLAEGFYTHLTHPFTDVQRGDIIHIENSDGGAKVYGINLEARANYRQLLDLQLGLTLQRSRYDDARKWFEPEDDEEAELDQVEATREMMRTPNSYAYFVATWTPIQPFSATLSGNYTGRMYVPHLAGYGVEGVDQFSTVYLTERSPSFFDINLRLAYNFKLNSNTTLQLNAGVQNIFNSYQKDFDTGAGRDNEYIYGPLLPRSYSVGLKVIF